MKASEVIRKMYNHLNARGELSEQAREVMKEYFSRVEKLKKRGKGRTAKGRSKLV